MIILKNVLTRIFSKKINIIFMLVIPIVLNIFIVALSTKDVTYTVGVIDEDKTECSRQVIEYLKHDAKVKVLSAKDDYKYKILNEGMECVFRINKGFATTILSAKKATVDSYSLDTSNIAKPIQIKVGSFVSVLETLAKESNYTEADFYDKVHLYMNKKSNTEYLYSAINANFCWDVTHISLGYIAFCMIFLMTFSTALIMEDKEIGIYNRLLTSPITAGSYYVQHLLSYLIVSTIQIVVVIFVLPLITIVNFGNIISYLQIIVICSIFSVFCISLGILINKFCKNTMMVGAVSSIVNMPLLILGGCFVPMDSMPNIVQKIGAFVPTNWFLRAADVVIYGKPFVECIRYLMYIITMVTFIFILVFLRIRKETIKS